MKKEDSIALKGVAIIMMLLYHLFYCGTGGGIKSLVKFILTKYIKGELLGLLKFAFLYFFMCY